MEDNFLVSETDCRKENEYRQNTRVMKYAVAQIGARMHYAVPRILDSYGALSRFYADACAHTAIWQLARRLPTAMLPKRARSFLARYPQGVPAARIKAMQLLGFRKALSKVMPEDYFRHHLAVCKEFTGLVIKDLATCDHDGVYCFGIGGLEILDHAGGSNKVAVLEQAIAPRRLMHLELERERELFPGWAKSKDRPQNFPGYEEFVAREEEEWNAADHIICGSEFVVRKIADSGGPREKCIVVPYGVAPPQSQSMPRERKAQKKLRVLTVGSLGLRKGTQYVCQVAKRTREIAEYRMVGSVDLSEEATSKLATVAELTGSVPRGELEEHYNWADVFFLPSLWEGSATVCYEALVRGLPVICSPSTGSIVEDGCNGFVVPARELEQQIDVIERIAKSDELLRLLSVNAVNSHMATYESYGERLHNALSKFLHNSNYLSNHATRLQTARN